MPRLPGLENLPRARAPRDPGLRVPDLGAGARAFTQTGQQVAQVGARIGEAQVRMRARESAVQRARDFGAFVESTTSELQRASTKGDLSSSDTVRAFGEFVREQKRQVLGAHKGNRESRLLLEERLESASGRVLGQAAAIGVEAQRARVSDTLGSALNGLMARAREDPSDMNALFDALDDEVDNLAPALTPNEERDRRQAGRGIIIEAAIESFLLRGDIDAAEDVLLETPGIGQILGEESQRRVFGQIGQVRAEMRRAEQAGLNTITQLRTILGREPTPQERMRAAGVAPPTGAGAAAGVNEVAKVEAILGRQLEPEERERLAGISSPADEGVAEAQAQIAEIRTLLGRDPTEQELLQLRGIDDAATPEQAGQRAAEERRAELTTLLGREPTEQEILSDLGLAGNSQFGRGLTGSILQMMADNAPAFGAGQLPPEQDREFQAAVQQYLQPTTFQNPDTGRIETRRNEVPEFVREAFQARGVPLPGQEQLTPGGSEAEPQATGAAGQADQPGGPGGLTVFELAGEGLVTGPGAVIGESAGRLPLTGGLAPQTTQARSFVRTLQRDLVRVLQNNPRFAEGERKAIENEIDITGSVFDNPAAFQQRLIGIDQALEVRLQAALKTAGSEVGQQERTHALNVANAIQNFRSQLLPPRFEDAKEAVEFLTEQPSGAKILFREEDQWVVKTKR